MNTLSIPKQSLVEDAARVLRREILNKRWSGLLPAERTLAVLLRVSRPTVRVALKILTAEGLLSMTRGRRHTRTTIARRRQLENKIVLVSANSLDELNRRMPFVLIWLDDLRNALAQDGKILEVASRPSCYTRRPSSALTTLVQQTGADCWLLHGSTPAMQEWFSKRGLRHIVIGSSFKGGLAPSLDVDQAVISRHAVIKMARLGHRDLAFITERSVLAGDALAKDEFQRAAREYAASSLRAIVIEHDGSRGGTLRATDHLLQMDPRPTAILCMGPSHALTVFSRLFQRGCRIPGDISLICRDDHPTLEYLTPTLARFERNQHDYARKVYRVIQAVLHHAPGETTKVRLLPEYVPGESLGPAPHRIRAFPL